MGIENADIYKEGIDTVLNTDLEALRMEQKSKLKEETSSDIGKKLGLGKIIKTKPGVLIGEDAWIIVDEKNKPLMEVSYFSKSQKLGKILDVFSDGRFIYEKGAGIVNFTDSQTITLYNETYNIKKINEFRKDGIIIADNQVLLFDMSNSGLDFMTGELNIGNILNVTRDKSNILRIIGSKGIYINSIDVKDKISIGSNITETFQPDAFAGNEQYNSVYTQALESSIQPGKGYYESFGIGDYISMEESNGIYLIHGNQGTLRIEKNFVVKYTIPNSLGIGKIDWINSNGLARGENGIVKVNSYGKVIFNFNKKELGLMNIEAFGYGNRIIGKGLDGKDAFVKINGSTGEIIERSSDISDYSKKELNKIGIYDIERLGNTKFVDYILENRKNIEGLKGKNVILIIHPKSDYNQAFSVDNMSDLRFDNNVLYYEIGSDTDLEKVFIELQKYGITNISHFILGGHGNQTSITFDDELSKIDPNRGKLDIYNNDGAILSKYAHLFKNTESIVLKSCSTGKGGAQGKNVLSLVASSFGKYAKNIIAPQEDTNSYFTFKKTRSGYNYNTVEYPLAEVKFYTDKVSSIPGSKVK